MNVVRAALFPPSAFRSALRKTPALERDAWIDRLLGITDVPDDGAALPREAVPYLPCGVEVVTRAVELAQVEAGDVFVDVGAGIGRALAVAHLLTGARAIGVEVQPQLVARARALMSGFVGIELIEADATAQVPDGTVYFLYCPFSGARLEAFLSKLEAIARTRRIRLCTVDLPMAARPWLQVIADEGPLTVSFSGAPGSW